jgi:hypothetical protein
MWAQPGHVNAMLGHLKQKLESGMIEKGKNGELGCRLLLLLAKDLCAATLPNTAESLQYCADVPVVAWLDKLLGPNAWPKGAETERAAREAFGGAVLNFSHWIAMGEDIQDPDTKKKRTLECVIFEHHPCFVY